MASQKGAFFLTWRVVPRSFRPVAQRQAGHARGNCQLDHPACALLCGEDFPDIDEPVPTPTNKSVD